MAEKKLSKKALNSGFHRWYYGNLTCFSQEHMQTFGYLCSMLPLSKELYADDPDKMAESMDTYRHTEPSSTQSLSWVPSSSVSQQVWKKHVQTVRKMLTARPSTVFAQV